MKLAIASDHGGFDLKEELKQYLAKKGFDVTDVGGLAAYHYETCHIAALVLHAVEAPALVGICASPIDYIVGPACYGISFVSADEVFPDQRMVGMIYPDPVRTRERDVVDGVLAAYQLVQVDHRLARDLPVGEGLLDARLALHYRHHVLQRVVDEYGRRPHLQHKYRQAHDGEDQDDDYQI